MNPELWTALIPAAGRGSRLGSDKPKILFPIAGRPILDWLMDLLSPLCSRFVFVVSPEGQAPVVAALAGNTGRNACATEIQQQPLGMADAVARGLPAVETTNTLIIWGDQVAVRRESLELAMRAHQGDVEREATIPTLWRDRPYIHFERDAAGRVARVLQAREGDEMPAHGESDCGVFLFRTESLRRTMPALLSSSECIGRKTRELNFLPIFPMLDRLVTMPIMTEAESVGVNSPADAEYLERCLKAGAW